MKKRKATKSVVAAITVALVAGAAVYFLDAKKPKTVRADSRRTTALAATAGARVLPTDRPLKNGAEVVR